MQHKTDTMYTVTETGNQKEDEKNGENKGCKTNADPAAV